MLEHIKQYLTKINHDGGVNQSEISATQTSFAATALLLEVARADQNLLESEMQQIETTITTVFAVDVSEVRQTLQSAQTELDQATCLHELTTTINANWDRKEKIDLIEAMWRVVLSDQHLDPNENHLMRKIKELLHIPQSEYIAAKVRATKSTQTTIEA